jgi:hypothetical protein
MKPTIQKLDFDIEELIAVTGDSKLDYAITALVNEPSDERFETYINVCRAARAFGRIGDGLSNGNTKSLRCRFHRILFCGFFCLRLLLLSVLCHLNRFLRSGKKLLHPHCHFL